MSEVSQNQSLDNIKASHLKNISYQVKHEDIFEDASQELYERLIKKEQDYHSCYSQVSITDGLSNNQERIKSMSCDHFMISKSLTKKVKQRVDNPNNKVLYPDLMGPHPLYVLSCSKSLKINSLVELRSKLEEHVNNWLESEVQKTQKTEKTEKISKPKRVGIKYNKYSLQFKLDVVNKIKQQIISDGENAKSLRFYIVKEANQLNIHPKNITRWFETKDLQNSEGGRKAKFPVLEFELSKFINLNPHCKRKQIVQQAKRLLLESGEAKDDFNFSKGWYERFRVRLRQEKVKRSMKDIIIRKDSNGYQKQEIKMQDSHKIVQKDSGQKICNSKVKLEQKTNDLKPFKIIKIGSREAETKNEDIYT